MKGNCGLLLVEVYLVRVQGHRTDRFGGISVRKTCNRLKCSVREMSSRAFVFGEMKMTFWAQK